MTLEVIVWGKDQAGVRYLDNDGTVIDFACCMKTWGRLFELAQRSAKDAEWISVGGYCKPNKELSEFFRGAVRTGEVVLKC